MALHRLAAIELAVPNLETSSAFFSAFGLSTGAPATDPQASRRFGTRDGGEQLVLTKARHRGVRSITVEVDDADDLDRIGTRLAAADHTIDRTGSRLRVTEPHSRIDVFVDVAARRTTTPTPAVDETNAPGRTTRINRPAHAIMDNTTVQPSSLAHAVIGSPNQPATLAFFTDLIGFEISDQLPGIIAFTRCSESHHNLAIQLAPCPLLHHVAFEVDSIDDVARAGSELIRADETRQLWGLGRHAIGSNWFWYLREPNGHYVEYTADIDRITSQDLYEPKEWVGHEFLYSFGQPPPQVFLEPSDMAELIAAG
jgi:catechol 2,3-dioxygenase-like lactoylglutathione lyase family enzyme